MKAWKIALAIAAALATLLPLAAGANEPQRVTGTILVGNPAVLLHNGLNERMQELPQGIDGYRIPLATPGTGRESVTLHFASPLPAADLDVRFFTSAGTRITTNACASESNPENCLAPAGAASVIVNGVTGAAISFEFTYARPT